MDKKEIKREALRIFAKKGYHGATMEQIADSLEVSKPAVYYYFNSKLDLYLEILTDFSSLFTNESMQICERLNDEPIESYLKAIFFMLIQFPSHDINLFVKKTHYLATFDNNQTIRTKCCELIKKSNVELFEGIKLILLSMKIPFDQAKFELFNISFNILIKGFTDWILLYDISSEAEIVQMADKLWKNFWLGNKFI